MSALAEAENFSVALMSREDALYPIARICDILSGRFPVCLEERTTESLKEAYAVSSLFCLFEAERIMLGENSESVVDSMVPWEKSTHLPSFPSLVADARHIARYTSGMRSVVAVSFTEWKPAVEEKAPCMCAGEYRTILLRVMIRNVLRFFPGKEEFILSQYVGVESEDKKHIALHYEFYPEDVPVVEGGSFKNTGRSDIRNICLFENSIRFSGDAFLFSPGKHIAAKNFNTPVFMEYFFSRIFEDAKNE